MKKIVAVLISLAVVIPVSAGVKPSKIYHAVIMTAYDEGEEVLGPSIEAVKNNTFPNDHIIFTIASIFITSFISYFIDINCMC